MKPARCCAVVAVRAALLCACAQGTAWGDATPSATSALESAIQRCALIVARDDRLACYDALASTPPIVAPSAAPPVPRSSQGSLTVAAAAAVPIPTSTAAAAAPPAADPLPPLGAASAPPVAASPPPGPAESERPEDFGLSPAQRDVQPKRIASITARVFGFKRGNSGSLLVVLDNGQSWQLDEADPLLAVGDAITIRRASLGSFLMITPSHRTHRVRRTQ